MLHSRFLSFLLLLLALATSTSAESNDLIKAAGRGDIQRVKELIEAKADVNARDKNGQTALMEAAFRGYADIATLLLDKGADIEASNKFGGTALLLARSTHMVKLLLDKGANTEAKGKIFRHTALMEAAISGRTDIATLLLDKGANVEAKGSLVVAGGEQGMPRLVDLKANVTALILAAANGKADVVKLLLDRGANPEAEKDRTASTSVALLRSTDAVMLLREAAARHSAQATSGVQAPSQPALPSTSHLAGLYQSEQLGTSPKNFYEYLRLYCDGRVLELSMGGPVKPAEMAKFFDKALGASGTYQIQGTAIQFSIQSPEGTVDYQGQIEGTGLSLDSFSHINGHRRHITYQLVQPGHCEEAPGTPSPRPTPPAATPPAPVAAPVQEGATSAPPVAVARIAEQPSSAQNNSQNPGQTRRDLGPENKLSLCAFRIPIADAAGTLAAPGLLGAVSTAMGQVAAAASAPYRLQLRKDFQGIYEDALKEVPSFQYTSNEKLTVKKDGKQLSLPEAVKENQLCACVRAVAVLGSHSGFKKKVYVKTIWEILGSSGCKLKIDTEATSKEAYGVFPYPLDPKLKPVFLELAGETAQQFSAKFPQLMKESGCPQQMQMTNEGVLQDKSEGTVKSATTAASKTAQPSTGSPNSSATPAKADAIALPPAAPKEASAAPAESQTAAASAAVPPREFTNSVGMKFVLVEPGSYKMGSQRYGPVHDVTLSKGFYLQTTEVTQAQWEAVMGTNPSTFKGPDRPVETISWDDIQEFLRNLNAKQNDTRYRLPTEAEWEYACGAGGQEPDEARNLDEVAWTYENSRRYASRGGEKGECLGVVRYAGKRVGVGPGYVWPIFGGTASRSPGAAARRAPRGSGWRMGSLPERRLFVSGLGHTRPWQPLRLSLRQDFLTYLLHSSPSALRRGLSDSSAEPFLNRKEVETCGGEILRVQRCCCA